MDFNDPSYKKRVMFGLRGDAADQSYDALRLIRIGVPADDRRVLAAREVAEVFLRHAAELEKEIADVKAG